MSWRDSDKAPVTFHNVAASFSQEEWKLLHDWQKELYDNVMKEIQQAVVSLAPVIATAVFSLTVNEQGLCSKNPQDSERSQDSKEAWDWAEKFESRKTQYSGSQRVRKERWENGSIAAVNAPEPGNPIITSELSLSRRSKKEAHFQELELERANTAVPVITSVFSLLQLWEDKTLKEEWGVKEKNKDDGSMNRNWEDRDSVRSINVKTPLKAKANKIHISGKRQNYGSQWWSQSSQESGRANTIQCERGFSNLAHSNLHQETHDIKESVKPYAFEVNAVLPACPLGTLQNSSSQKGKSLRPKRVLKNRERKKYFRCTECPKSFIGKGALMAHKKLNSGKELHKCTTCEKSFHKKGHLTNHQKFHLRQHKLVMLNLKEKPDRELKKNVIWKGNLNPHLEEDNDAKKPSESEKSTFEEADTIMNASKHSRDRRFTCTFCSKSFHQKGGLVAHHRTHTGEKPFQCDTCLKRFSMKANLVTHQKRLTCEKPYQCTYCEKHFLQKGNLVEHLERYHEMRKTEFERNVILKGSAVTNIVKDQGEKLHKCTECEKSFHQRRGLLIHHRAHTVKKPYQCTTCEKSFRVKAKLDIHQRMHSKKELGETNLIRRKKPFQCTKCEKCFSQQVNLTLHLRRRHEKIKKGGLLAHHRTYTGKTLHHCTTCTESFITKAELVTHQREHTGETPYQCNECEKCFRSMVGLAIHMGKFHGKKKKVDTLTHNWTEEC